MGVAISTIFSYIFGNKERRFPMLGFDAVGKTSILYKLKTPDNVIQTIPTVGFNVETVIYANIKFTMWDVGGGDKIRLLWKHYLTGCNGLIFVVDSTDRERVEFAGWELFRVLSEDDLDGAATLIFANKQDLPEAMSTEEITEKLRLKDLNPNKNYHLQGCSALTGQGLFEGLQWLSNQLK